MADISRNTTPAWQDPHLKDRGDYTEQDIQNIQEKGGILPDFTLDEAEETHLFARVAQALSKTLTRQGLTVRHEAKAAAEPMGYRLDEHAIAIDTRRPWKDIALDLAHALGAIQVARDALNPADQPQGAAEWNRYKDKVCFVKLGSAFCAVFFRSVGSGFSAGCAVSAAACLRCVGYLVMRACSLR